MINDAEESGSNEAMAMAFANCCKQAAWETYDDENDEAVCIKI